MINSMVQMARTRQIPATIATLVACIALPFAFHLLPVSGTPLGARLLPIFYAPLLAIILVNPAVGILTAGVAPLANHLVIGTPSAEMATLLTVELVVFALVVMALQQRFPKFYGVGPVAYIVGKAASFLMLLILPILPVPPAQFFVNGLITALPGMVILLLLSIGAIQIANNIHARKN